MNNHLKVLILSILILSTLFTIYMIINIPNSKETLKNSVEEEQPYSSFASTLDDNSK